MGPEDLFVHISCEHGGGGEDGGVGGGHDCGRDSPQPRPADHWGSEVLEDKGQHQFTLPIIRGLFEAVPHFGPV